MGIYALAVTNGVCMYFSKAKTITDMRNEKPHFDPIAGGFVALKGWHALLARGVQ